MTKNKVLRHQAKDLNKKKINSRKIINHFNKSGVIIVENILNKKKTDFFINLLEKKYEKCKHLYFTKKLKAVPSHSQFYFAKNLENLHNKDFKFLEFVDNPITLRLINLFLKQGSYRNSDNIICQNIGARTAISKSRKQQLHNDTRLVGSHFPLIVQVMWTLDPFTKHNGATRFVLGSHKFMKYPQKGKTYKNEQVIEAPSGSVIIFNGAVWHGSSKVVKNSVRRWMIICRYARWFLKPSFDFQKNTPIKTYNKMNKTQRDLLGFRFNPPKDEFSGFRTKQKKYQKPSNYTLPV